MLFSRRIPALSRFPMAAPTHYDAIVVGSGQSGTPLAAAFAAAGRKTAMVERDHIGGTCVNVGCTPTKTLIASGRVAYLAGRAGDYGIELSASSSSSAAGGQPPQTDMLRVRQRLRDIVSSFRGGGEARLTKAGVDILRGSAAFVGPKTLKVTPVEAGEAAKTIEADLIFLNTGERPLRPALPGLDTVPTACVLDSSSILELDVVPQHLLVVGGGYIGIEFAHAFRRLGAAVTVVQRGPQLLPRDDPDVVAALTQILRDDGLTVHLSADVTAFSVVTAASDNGNETLPIEVHIAPSRQAAATDAALPSTVRASHVLLAAGRTPNSDSLRLDVSGVKTTPRGHIIVDDQLATSAPGVYALGDVHGGPAFTHMSYDDYRIVTANLLPKKTGDDRRGVVNVMTTATSKSRTLVPYVVYTDPQLGHVGLHERDIRSKTDTIKTISMPMSWVARALETDEPRGLMKATVDVASGEILGFTCLGLEGGELMAVVQTAIMGGLRWWDLADAVWAHPSLAESLNNLFSQLK